MAAPNTLSVVLPVHNEQDTLALKIGTLLDLLPELTSHFEILIVDEASRDHTSEIAHELARTYPQIFVTRHERRRGPQGVVESALALTHGEVLFIHDERAPIDTTQFHRLWSLRTDERVAAPPSAKAGAGSLVQRLAAWGLRLEAASRNGEISGLQMLRRPARAPAVGARRSAVAGSARQHGLGPRYLRPETMPLTDFGSANSWSSIT
ncbi:MAG: glycosyltransferase family 2 protein [Pirellulaceae bacterium]